MSSSFIRPLRFSSPRVGGTIMRYGQSAKGDPATAAAAVAREIGTRAKSTAEEFTRIAEEKAEASAAEGVKETLDKAKDAMDSVKDNVKATSRKENV